MFFCALKKPIVPLAVALQVLFSLPLSAQTNQSSTDAEKTLPPKIAIIGDSLARDYPDDFPRRGWGQLLVTYLKPEVIVINEASSGRSSKTFPADRWTQILADRPDFVLIQFGHEDAKAEEGAEPVSVEEYKDNLRRYVTEAHEAKAFPILVTPLPPREFKKGHLMAGLANYAQAVREVGTETNTPVIDVYGKTSALYESLGEAGSAAMTINKTGWNADRDDRTHLTPEGARQIAKMISDDFRAIDPKLAAAVK